jgi:hypothetical protein
VQADAAMQPRHGQDGRLLQPAGGLEHPDDQQLVGVGIIGPVDHMDEPRADDVDGQQRRDQQPDDQLGRFPSGHSQAASPIDRPERQPEMDDQRSIENDRPDRVAPQPQEWPASMLHGLKRDDAEGVVGEMGEEIERQDEPGRESNPRNDAARFNHASRCRRADRKTRAVQSHRAW